MTDETSRRDELPAFGDPDDDGGDFATEHEETTVDDDEDEVAGPTSPKPAPPAHGGR